MDSSLRYAMVSLPDGSLVSYPVGEEYFITRDEAPFYVKLCYISFN